MENIIIEIIIFAFLILLAGLLAAAELAISTVGENKIEELKQQKNNLVPYFEIIQKNPESFGGSLRLLYTFIIVLSAIVGFNLVLKGVNYLFSLFENSSNGTNLSFLAIVIAVILITAFLLVFCLLIPKAIGSKYSDSLAIVSVKPLLSLSKMLSVPVKILTGISNILLKPFNERTSFSESRPSEDEILELISDGVKSGAIDESEQEIIENVLEFNDLKADEVMVPRIEMVAVDLNEDKATILKEIMKTGHSLVPAYEETPDNIIGVIHTKDLMRKYLEKKNISLKNIVRPAYFIPETKPISEVLKEMQIIGERLAIVTDEYGGTEGIITLEDILEEIVGEIKDKTKIEVSEFSRFPDGTYCILGSMDIDDFNENFNHQLQESDEYNTVAGFIAEKTGIIMSQGDSFNHEGIQFELIKKIGQKMVQFKVYSERNDFMIIDKKQKDI
jgi:putative hemolysin